MLTPGMTYSQSLVFETKEIDLRQRRYYYTCLYLMLWVAETGTSDPPIWSDHVPWDRILMIEGLTTGHQSALCLRG